MNRPDISKYRPTPTPKIGALAIMRRPVTMKSARMLSIRDVDRAGDGRGSRPIASAASSRAAATIAAAIAPFGARASHSRLAVPRTADFRHGPLTVIATTPSVPMTASTAMRDPVIHIALNISAAADSHRPCPSASRLGARGWRRFAAKASATHAVIAKKEPAAFASATCTVIRLKARRQKNSRTDAASSAVVTNVLRVSAAASAPASPMAANNCAGRATPSRACRATRNARPIPSRSSAASATPAKDPGGPTR